MEGILGKKLLSLHSFISGEQQINKYINIHSVSDIFVRSFNKKMNNSLSKEELENKPKALDETFESGNDPTESQKIYEVIVVGGENKKSVEHILLPACLPKGKNLLARLWSAIFSRKSSENPQSKTDEANLLGKWSYLKPMRNRREAFLTAIYQDEMFAFGTRSGARCFETLELNNPRARWQFHGDILSEYISAPAAVVYGDSVYIFGGNIQGRPCSNVYRLLIIKHNDIDIINSYTNTSLINKVTSLIHILSNTDTSLIQRPF